MMKSKEGIVEQPFSESVVSFYIFRHCRDKQLFAVWTLIISCFDLKNRRCSDSGRGCCGGKYYQCYPYCRCKFNIGSNNDKIADRNIVITQQTRDKANFFLFSSFSFIKSIISIMIVYDVRFYKHTRSVEFKISMAHRAACLCGPM